MKKISICVPVYDSEEHIHETLDSVYGQNYPDLEIIVSIDLNIKSNDFGKIDRNMYSI